jgi:hypothetical protein
MKLFTKIAIASIALAGMLQAETTLIGVDGGITVLNARVGFNAGITVGTAHHHAAGAYTTVTSSRTYTTDPCSYVCGPCVVVAPPCPEPAPKPACPCDPCAN